MSTSPVTRPANGGRSRARLRRSDCSAPGITRRRRGRGFSYADADSNPVTDQATLARIGALAIPPAWREVWICPDPSGHIQATGLDAAGRKQYLYHERWQQRAAQRKFESMREFAAALPRLRRQVKRDLAVTGMPRERALACAVRLLDLGFFRVGGEEYAEANGSFGLATLRRGHVEIKPGRVDFDFPAKSGQRRQLTIRDREVSAAIKQMCERGGDFDDLLAYLQDGEWQDVRSEEINEYLKAKAGAEFSAKDFRTWHGTVLAAVELAREETPRSSRAAARAISAAIKRVAERLGNTPAICRSSYIDPRVLDRFRDGKTIERPALPADDTVSPAQRARTERQVLELIA